jgi:transketolase
MAEISFTAPGSSEALAHNIRVQCLRMVHRARASHIGSALSITDILAVLYGTVIKNDKNNPKWEGRDRLILSKGHACVAIYAVLAERGYFDKSELETYGTDHSNFMAHISHKVPGVEFSTGSLGHGLPFGVGKALTAKKQERDWRTFVVLSDGEMDEGSNWEAIMFASHHHLDNLVAIIDYNKLQSLTTVSDTLGIEPLAHKFEAFGWCAREIDGHDHTSLKSALSSTPWENGKPSVLIAHTTKGKGVSFMENCVDWHYKSPNDQQLAQALSELRERSNA